MDVGLDISSVGSDAERHPKRSVQNSHLRYQWKRPTDPDFITKRMVLQIVSVGASFKAFYDGPSINIKDVGDGLTVIEATDKNIFPFGEKAVIGVRGTRVVFLLLPMKSISLQVEFLLSSIRVVSEDATLFKESYGLTDVIIGSMELILVRRHGGWWITLCQKDEILVWQ